MFRILCSLSLIVMSMPAAAQQVCANRQTLIGSLADDFREQPAALGMADDGNLVEVLASKDGRTWTILITTPDGISCVVATGQAWEAVPQQLAGSEL